MSIRLILMRHAKSDWGGDTTGDFERPLSKRGRKSASAIGQWLAKNNYLPDTVLCSSAIRTRETWDLVKAELGTAPDERSLRSLYLAAPEQMLVEIAGLKARKVAMMVAHNPGTAVLAQTLADRVPAHERFEDCPTGATTVFEFATDDWSKIAPSRGQVIDFVVPRDLF